MVAYFAGADNPGAAFGPLSEADWRFVSRCHGRRNEKIAEDADDGSKFRILELEPAAFHEFSPLDLLAGFGCNFIGKVERNVRRRLNVGRRASVSVAPSNAKSRTNTHRSA